VGCGGDWHGGQVHHLALLEQRLEGVDRKLLGGQARRGLQQRLHLGVLEPKGQAAGGGHRGRGGGHAKPLRHRRGRGGVARREAQVARIIEPSKVDISELRSQRRQRLQLLECLGSERGVGRGLGGAERAGVAHAAHSAAW
jgi:hypothetical protein